MKPTLLCLHGWGGSQASFTELRAALHGTDIEILTPDLPGFGSEPEPPRPWSIDDYADWVVQWLQARKPDLPSHNQQPITSNQQLFVLGHSHGGRIAIKLASRQSISQKKAPLTLTQTLPPIDHLFLCAAAGIRRGQYVKRAVSMIFAKTGKALLSVPVLLNHFQPLARKLLYRIVRTHDYERASPMMRQTMHRVTAENLRPFLKDIRVPTDIFWGRDDATTPYRDALIAKREIKGSTLHSYKGVRHGVHREKAGEIAEVIRKRVME